MTEFVFDTPAWEQVLSAVKGGSKMSATRLLALMEQEPEETLESALMMLEEKNVLLDISDLPRDLGSGEMAVRLRQEAQLVKNNKLPGGLEENDPLRLYLEEVAAIPACGDVQVLAENLLAGDQTAAQKLTDLMLSRVIESALALTERGVLLLDLIQEGSLGLWQAITRYCGGELESHCDRYIQRALARPIILQAKANGVGRKMQQAMEDYRDTDQRLLSELGRNPTPEEIALQMHMTLEEVSAVAETLDAARLIGRAKKETAAVEQEDEQHVEDTAYFQMRQRITELLEQVSEEEAKILTLRFGLEGGLPLSPEETGKRLGLTPEEIVAKEATALAKLRQMQ